MFLFPGEYLEILHFCDCSEMHTKAKRVEDYKKDTNRVVTFFSPKDGGSLLPQAPDGQHESLAVITQKPGFLFIFPKNACFHLKPHKNTMLFLVYFTPDKNYIMPRVIGLGYHFKNDGMGFISQAVEACLGSCHQKTEQERRGLVNSHSFRSGCNQREILVTASSASISL